MNKKQLKDIETQAMIDKWQEELARHVAYLPILCEQACFFGEPLWLSLMVGSDRSSGSLLDFRSHDSDELG